MEEKAPLIRYETLVDLVLLALGIVIVAVSFGYGFGTLDQPGPGLYPVFLGMMIAVTAFAILLSDLKSRIRLFAPDKESAKTIFLLLLTFCLWIVVMEWLGYVLVTVLATYAAAKIMKLEGWMKPLAVSLGTALLLYLLFDYWLYIDLPRGIFE
ncbi:MAG TPA: tripartite tricarboxylate transporter TctB family protein [Nitrolancea sp.]|nr:tripartite tricarboxylate transporter TctB family protein [Nitrolancea sp.]